MPSFKVSLVAAAMAVIASVDAHVVMKQPTLYNPSTAQTSPLNGDNFKFPCQLGPDASAYGSGGAGTAVSAGSTTPVAFTGSAVHGGGVCQFSVTYEHPPPADKSKWKVIHTIIGGCPASAAGNIPTSGSDANGRPDGPQCGNDSGTECVRKFNIPIPKGLKNGKATFAWTWFNKIGNREMYMNCAPITISGGSSDDSFTNSLPSMFVANIPGQCQTGQGLLDIPNPGSSVQRNETPSPGSLGSCPATGGGSGGGSGGSPPPPATPPTTPPKPSQTVVPPPPPAGSATPRPSNPGGIFAPKPSTTLTKVITKPTTIPTIPEGNAPQPGTGAGNGGNGGNSGKCPAGSVPCSNPGAMVCSGKSQWGTCDIDNCAVLRPVAQGTVCDGGAVAAAAKRSTHGRRHKSRFALRHAHHHV